MPENLTGTFRIVAKLDTGPFQSTTVDRTIEIRAGRWTTGGQ